MEWGPYGPLMVFPREVMTARHRLAAEGHPGDPKLLLRLASALLEADAFSEAMEIFDRAAAIPDAATTALCGKARIFLAMGTPDLALGCVRQALALAPVSITAHLLHAQVHRHRNRLTEAEAVLRFCLKRHGPEPRILAPLTSLLLKQGRPDAVLDLLDGLDAPRVLTTPLLAARADALLLKGRTEEAAALLAVDHLVMVSPLPPSGSIAGADFNARLEAEILAAPSYQSDPPGKSTCGGCQTQSLLYGGAVALPALLKAIKSAVEAYVDGLSTSTHPWTVTRPNRAMMNAWAVVLGPGGHQKAHIHPKGWLSGCYYVKVPAECGIEPDATGALVIQQRPDDGPASQPVRRVAAEAGHLVLFPSYLRHSTIPLRGADPRICVAFDIIPM